MSKPILGGMVVCRPKPVPYRNGTVFRFHAMSDLHIGAAHVDYKLIEKEVEVARAGGGRVAINGDVFDAILSSDKKRFSVDALHPKLARNRDFMGAAIRWAADILEPIAPQIDMIGCGNHDEHLVRYANFDPISALTHELSSRLPKQHKDHIIHHGGYTGFLDYRFRWEVPESRRTPSRLGGSKRYVIYYHHGSGSAAPVTRGMIDFARRETFIDADLLWLGHKHNRWNASSQKVSCPQDGDHVNLREVRHLMTGSYFLTYCGQSQESIKKHGRRTNYAADMGLAPQGVGGAVVEISFGSHDQPFTVTVRQ